MNDVARTFRDRADLVADVVERGGDLDAPSPCEGWTGRDVLHHLVTTQADMLDQHGFGVPRVDLGEDPVGAWRTHTDHVVSTLAREEVADHVYDGMFGPTTVGDTMRDFYGFDLLVHRWDVGEAVGVPVSFSDDELDVIDAAAGSFGDAIRMEGICGPAVDVDDDQPRQVRVLAFLGRDARA